MAGVRRWRTCSSLVREEVTRLDAAAIGLLGLTVAVPGLIDRARGVVVAAPNLGWTDVPLADALRRELGSGVPVAVDNDANCAARAESLRGVASGVDDFVYLTGTVGLGAGIVCGGQVLRGSRGLAGEVGHLRVGDDRRLCACGRTGCWEALVGLRALVQATGIDVRPREDPVSYAERVVGTPGTEPAILAVADALARGVAQLTATLDPRMIVLGGSFVPLGRLLVPAVEEAIAAGFTGPGCTVALSTLGLHAASVGAAVDALDDVYAGRRSLLPGLTIARTASGAEDGPGVAGGTGQHVDGVVQQVGEGELGRTDDHRVATQRGHHDLRLLGGGVERPLVQGVDHVRADERVDPAQDATEDHHLGVEDVHQPAEAQAEVAPEGAQLGRAAGTRAGGTPAAGASRSSGSRPPRPPRASRSRSPSSPRCRSDRSGPAG